MEEKHTYCVWCGSKNIGNNTKCSSCKKNLSPKHHVFIYFLRKHTKDSLKGDVEDRLYEAIKNFLLSHLYGLVVSISLILVVAELFLVINANNYIQKVSDFPLGSQQVEENNNIIGEDLRLINENLTAIASELDSVKFQAGNEILNYLISDNLYNSLTTTEEVVYDFYNNYIDDSIFPYVNIENNPHNVMTIVGSLTNQPQTTCAKKLIELGYKIAVGKMNHSLYQTQDGSEILVAEANYLITYALEEGKWLMAEAIYIEGE